MNHLTDEELLALKRRLRERRERLEEEIREELRKSDKEQYGELAGEVHDMGDEAVADLLADLNVSTVSRLIMELREAEAALQRMAMGSYGLCEDCNTPIPFERLSVSPSARRCLEHQEQQERLFKEGKRPIY